MRNRQTAPYLQKLLQKYQNEADKGYQITEWAREKPSKQTQTQQGKENETKKTNDKNHKKRITQSHDKNKRKIPDDMENNA